MVKEDWIEEKLQQKKEKKKHLKIQLKAQEAQIVHSNQNITYIELEISLLEEHIKKEKQGLKK